MSPDVAAAGVFGIVGAVVGGVVGAVASLFVGRWVRNQGEVCCEIDGWTVHKSTSLGAEERRLQVTFLNEKELPVTVRDVRVVFYKEGKPLEDWTHPNLYFVDEQEQFS